jgi:hypothetical protein
MGVDRGAPDQAFRELELDRKFTADGGEDAEGFGHHLGPDAISGEDCDLEGAHRVENASARFCLKAESAESNDGAPRRFSFGVTRVSPGFPGRAP